MHWNLKFYQAIISIGFGTIEADYYKFVKYNKEFFGDSLLIYWYILITRDNLEILKEPEVGCLPFLNKGYGLGKLFAWS